MTPSTPTIRTEYLEKEYRERPALVDPNFDVYPDRIVGLVGPNGCGKATLPKVLIDVLAGWSGTVTIDGKTPGVDTRRHVAFLPSTDFLDSRLAPPVAVKLYARFLEGFNTDKALSPIRSFDPPLDHRLREISEGMGEKLRICPTMARKARLYLLDEPILGVDPATRDIILERILRDFDEDAFMFISTHLISDVESILDEVVMFKDGRVHRTTPVDDLCEECNISLDALFRREYH